MTLVFSGLLALVQIIFAASIALFIDAPNLEFQLRFFSLLIILNGLQTTQIAILSGFKKFKETAKINIYTGFVVFIGSIIMTWFWGLTGSSWSINVVICGSSYTESNNYPTRSDSV
ncbi:MAG: oligosaccharide flippase family protein [Alistipes finegoldii]